MDNQSSSLVELTSLPVPPIIDRQVDKFTKDSIHSVRVMSFDPARALAAIQANEGKSVIGADFGGDKGITQLFVVRDGRLVADDAYSDYVQGNGGDQYLKSMEKTAEYAALHGIPIGLSWGAPIKGSALEYHPKMHNFLTEIGRLYGGDIRAVMPSIKALLNDGSAGLISGAIEANRTQLANSVLFIINGGGLGMAVLADNIIYSTEAGHVEAVPELNKYQQTTPCAVFDAQYVCIENVGANKAGIESQWEMRNGQRISAKEIENKYKDGDEFAVELYDHSALVVAHMTLGTANSFSIDLANETSVVVGHGGAFKFPRYGERIQQILAQECPKPPKLIMTKDYVDPQSNACLEGAAYAALTPELL